MSSYNTNIPFNLVFIPLKYSPFSKYEQDSVMAPPTTQLLTTQTDVQLVTQTGEDITTQ